MKIELQWRHGLDCNYWVAQIPDFNTSSGRVPSKEDAIGRVVISLINQDRLTDSLVQDLSSGLKEPNLGNIDEAIIGQYCLKHCIALGLEIDHLKTPLTFSS